MHSFPKPSPYLILNLPSQILPFSLDFMVDMLELGGNNIFLLCFIWFVVIIFFGILLLHMKTKEQYQMEYDVCCESNP